MKVKDLVAEAVPLPVEERTALVDSLLQGLNAPEKDVEREWIAEAWRRLEEVRSGAAGSIPGDEVFAALLTRTPPGAHKPC